MKIAFVVDNLNFHGGAHTATRSLINRLKRDGHYIDVVSPDLPKIKSFRFRVRQFFGHLHLGWYPEWIIDPTKLVRNKLIAYDTVVCVGEPSSCRKLVSNLPKKNRKVMLIHTDYSTWSRFNNLSKEMSRYDRLWYSKYDAIGVVGIINAKKMADMIPQLAGKIAPFHNLFENIDQLDSHSVDIHEYPRIVTMMRVGDPPKRSERYLEVAQRLKSKGIRYDWHVYGESNQLNAYREKCKTLNIDDCFHFDGYTNTPMDKLKEADLMVMLSEYEGLPNTIYESFLCGTPVLSTNVGGIAEQIHEDYNGWLVENDLESIIVKLSFILISPEKIIKASKNLCGYKYDNDRAYNELCKLLGL